MRSSTSLGPVGLVTHHTFYQHATEYETPVCRTCSLQDLRRTANVSKLYLSDFLKLGDIDNVETHARWKNKAEAD